MKRIRWWGLALLILVLGGGMVYRLFSTTQIAFINYQVTTLGEIAQANEHARIRLAPLDVDQLDDLGRFDLVLVNGMGLRITAEQRQQLQQAADRGLAVITTMATNPANDLQSTDSATVATVRSYLAAGGRRNYRNLLTYIRRVIDGKTLDTDEPEAAVQRELKQFYHWDPTETNGEEKDFGTLAEYHAFLQQHGLLRAEAPRILLTGQMGEPKELIEALEKTGNVVYPVRNLRALVSSEVIDTIRPAAVINLAHGRLGDYIVDFLKQRNIPLFAPLNVNRLVDEWEADKMGMNGGFLSQSVVMPEIDGAIRPYALFGHYIDADGLPKAFAIPERLKSFVATVNNHIALQQKPNRDKKVAIYYYKGPGQNALTAAGMEVASSLYHLLVRLKKEGYVVDQLPASAAELERLIQRQGSVYNAYATGAKQAYMENGNPARVTAAEYARWTQSCVRPEKMAEVVALDGEFPGSYLSNEQGDLLLPRVELGNVVLLPQLAAGAGDDDFAIVHGTDAAPPHAYIASYLWARYAFRADVMMHFGTHGSLEFTPKKQVALSGNDWPDVLVGTLPHLYLYSIADVGEGMIAKRRSYATLQSYLTPPFMESQVRGIYKNLCGAIQRYNDLLYADSADSADTTGSAESVASAESKPGVRQAALEVKRLTVALGIHRELRMDSLLNQPYTSDEIARIETFAEELANEKVTGELYTMGKAYSDERIRSSVLAMSTEPIAYSLLALDKLRGKAAPNLEKQAAQFTRRYLEPARALVTRLLDGHLQASDAVIGAVAGISSEELRQARELIQSLEASKDRFSRMMSMMSSGNPAMSMMGNASMMGGMKHPAGISKEKGGKHPSWIPKIGKRPEETKAALHQKQASHPKSAKTYTAQEKNKARAIMEIARTIGNVANYRVALKESPEKELSSLLNALNGGYTAPSPGGDPIANPNTVPTGRNLYAVNAEATPSEVAWERGKELAENTIAMYRSRHNDSIPRKVSYTLWSGEFVETEGATIAQILYMLGVEPIRDVFGRVNDIRLIPSEQLGRPRIDVVVQTSGQLRDIAASRLFLISRAVEMAAAARNDRYDNYVAQSVVEAERVLIDRGMTPKAAREVSTYRVFGGVNGNYGTGITDMVQAGDRWESSQEIADVYLQNMGAFYGSEKEWEQVQQFALEAALTHTDAVVQPRQSNTWGALSLDHVYEFMGGMNLAVRRVTGKEPDAYLSDYRNRNRMRMQELKEAIGVESRTTLFNPHYIREKMKGESSAAAGFAEILQNTYGWNVMKPDAVDNELWDEVYEVYVKDKFDLGVQAFFEKQNPAALEEMTAVMMETARKGMWKATPEQLATLAKLHTELVDKYDPSCSGFVCNNAKLRAFISSHSPAEAARRYESQIRNIRESSLRAASDSQDSDQKSMVLKREDLQSADRTRTLLSNTLVIGLVSIAVIVLVWVIRRRRNKMEE